MGKTLFLCDNMKDVAVCSQGWSHSNSHAGLKKWGRHTQDTLNEDEHFKTGVTFKNDTGFWKRPRCGVPDYPNLMQLDMSHHWLKSKKGGLSRNQRRKRFALFGGRWEKNDLTYK